MFVPALPAVACCCHGRRFCSGTLRFRGGRALLLRPSLFVFPADLLFLAEVARLFRAVIGDPTRDFVLAADERVIFLCRPVLRRT